ncbi:MAG: M48 family metallopeptidase [Betaproteobacteria bacterium]|nr:M48 family metallopeptidase [Betaproteobacteria bacterium]
MRALKPRAAHYAGLIGRLEPELSISNARTQWGVCMEDGRIRLSLAPGAPAARPCRLRGRA